MVDVVVDDELDDLGMVSSRLYNSFSLAGTKKTYQLLVANEFVPPWAQSPGYGAEAFCRFLH